MDKATLAQWFMHIRNHAAKNYKRDGWDCFYECVDFADFVDTCERMKLDTVDKAFNEYEEWCGQKADQRADQLAEADSGCQYSKNVQRCQQRILSRQKEKP